MSCVREVSPCFPHATTKQIMTNAWFQENNQVKAKFECNTIKQVAAGGGSFHIINKTGK